MKLLRMKPGHGEIVLAEGNVEVAEEEQELIEAFRRELEAGMWAAVPTEHRDGRREAELVKAFAEVPRDAERVIFFPRAAGGSGLGEPGLDTPGPGRFGPSRFGPSGSGLGVPGLGGSEPSASGSSDPGGPQ